MRLYDAAHCGDLEAVARAILSGDDVGALSPSSRDSALHICAEAGHVEVARLLIMCGADPEVTDDECGTPLRRAAVFGKTAMIDFLLTECGADAAALDSCGRTALHCAAAQPNNSAAVEVLLRRCPPAMRDAVDVDGSTALHCAACAGCAASAEALLNAGAQVDAVDVGFSQALHLAAERNHAEVAALLLMRGADLEGAHELAPYTPLEHAAAAGACDTVALLLDRGARRVDVALRCAAACGRTAAMLLLARRGGSVVTSDARGETALHKAASRGDVFTTETLMKLGAPVDARSTSAETPLAMAIGAAGSSNVAMLLVRSEAELHISNDGGKTAISRASERGLRDVMMALLGVALDAFAV